MSKGRKISVAIMGIFLFFVGVGTVQANESDVATTSSLEAVTYSQEARVPRPILVTPGRDYVTGNTRPYITGLAHSGTRVKIYIDGVYNGKTEILENPSGTANFAYKPFLNLSIGWHKAWAVAEDINERKSLVSEILEFKIEEPMPAPIILDYKPSTDDNVILGLAKNDSLIKVYIDHKVITSFWVKNHLSGTANFVYNPQETLTRGSHLVYITATDKRGKESRWSNFKTIVNREPRIAEAVYEENVSTSTSKNESKISEPIRIKESDNIGTVKIINDAEAVCDNPNTCDNEDSTKEDILKELIDEVMATGSNNKVDSNEKKGVQWNIIIFVTFLVAIIFWIFWVNRELIKENKIDDNDSDDEKNEL